MHLVSLFGRKAKNWSRLRSKRHGNANVAHVGTKESMVGEREGIKKDNERGRIKKERREKKERDKRITYT